MLLISAVVSAPPAIAGPWTQKEGKGISIASAEFSFTKSPEWNTAGTQKFATSTYLEYGLTDDVTLGLKVDHSLESNQTTSPNGTIEALAFVRVGVWSDDNGGVAAAQLGLRAPGTKHLFGDAAAPETWEFGGEIVVSYGRGLATDWGNAFYAVEAGYSYYDGDDDEITLSFTTGIRPWDRTLLLLQSFATLGDDEEIKISPSLGWEFSETTTLQIGIVRDIVSPGDPATAVKLALWRKF